MVADSKSGENHNSTQAIQPAAEGVFIEELHPETQNTFIPIQAKLTVGAPDDPLEREADQMADRIMRMPDPVFIQRKCAHCEEEENKIRMKPFHPVVQRKCSECEEEEKLQMKPGAPLGGPAIASDSITTRILENKGGGGTLNESGRSFMESRFGTDFSTIRIHTGDYAVQLSKELNAQAFTVGTDIYFNEGKYSPDSNSGRMLLAHELTHTIQQKGAGEINRLQRLCSSTCGSPIAGAPAVFGVSEEAVEAGPRARRRRMSSARSLSSGHGGKARQLEIFFQAQAPGLLANLQGIFIDWDMSPGTGALTSNCADWITDSLPPGTIPPGMAGASRPCVFVHGNLNQEALAFNNTSNAMIGGVPREEWRIATLQILTHETQHVIFDTAPALAPAGITTATCTAANVASDLSEFSAILSEFPIVFRAIPAGAPAGDPARIRLRDWFRISITNPSEGISGILESMGCQCECPEVDAFITAAFNFTASGWTVAERAAFNAELNDPAWGIRWPIP